MSEEHLVELVQPLVDGETVLGAGVFNRDERHHGRVDGAGLGTNSMVGMAIGTLGVLVPVRPPRPWNTSPGGPSSR